MSYIVKIVIVTLCFPVFVVAQTTTVRGKISDTKGNPLAFVNVYLEDSMDGSSTNPDGTFAFRTSKKGQVKLIASLIGYADYELHEEVSAMSDLTILMKEETRQLDQVVVHAGNFVVKDLSSLKEKGSIDLVTTAGSDGDLFKAISLLPGSQVTGIDGKLLIRGGSSNESQTYIDDMHVPSPYGATGPNTQARARYSPFFFTGINFSTGGFSSEYSQSMSSVLPLYTRDEAESSKIGINLLNVSIGSGGTKAWDKASLSYNIDYGNLKPYNNILYPSQKDSWEQAVQYLSAQKQFRYTLREGSYLKTYYTFDRMTFKQHLAPAFSPARLMDFEDTNLYFNQTFRTKGSTGFHFFVGMAYGRNERRIKGASHSGDYLMQTDSELHLKTKGHQRFSDCYKIEIGAEGFSNAYKLRYEHTELVRPSINYQIAGAYVSNDFNITNRLLLTASIRGEYTSSNHSLAWLPRLALSWKYKDIVWSGVVARYQQLSNKDYLIYTPHLSNERNWQYQVGMYYQKDHRVFRLELYTKKYEHLTNQVSNYQYATEGEGYSRGVDVFLNNQLFMNHWDYIFSYSFNDSKRKYMNYPYKVQPGYATKHNASLSLRYTNLSKLRSIIGITARVASGFPYNDPNESAFMN